ncbi:MAG: hypothetical protein F6K62_22365 [Sphaerospermopsis sp. SIO1G2]|nr:hypothetical protein [Sphaerospermopsis sp. SIO1G2]
MTTQTTSSHTTSASKNKNKLMQVSEINYKNNVDSDYTEKIEHLDKEFKYENNNQDYWGQPELSLFYGSPLYEAASETQKLKLNHLFWATQYEHVAASETSTILYNQVTAGVFEVVGGYDTLCKTLDLETKQEKYHTHAFNNISYKTKQVLLGNVLFSSGTKFFREKDTQNSKSKDSSQSLNWFLPEAKQNNAFRWITNRMIKDSQKSYSPVLKKLDQRNYIPTLQSGYIGEALPRPALRFITYNWGTSPFLACQHYVWRYMGNSNLKLWEYFYVKYFRELEKKGAFIPAPTAVSYYHLLDESYHTTTSQLIARDLYKDFPRPSAYEIMMANLITYFMQEGILSQLSAGIPSLFRSDTELYPFFYRILRSPIFDFTAEEALSWMEKCFCYEHEGLHVNLKLHNTLLTDLKRLVQDIDYLWPVNREFRLMDQGASIEKTLASNAKAFQKFRKTVII